MLSSTPETSIFSPLSKQAEHDIHSFKDKSNSKEQADKSLEYYHYLFLVHNQIHRRNHPFASLFPDSPHQSLGHHLLKHAHFLVPQVSSQLQSLHLLKQKQMILLFLPTKRTTKGCL